MSATGEITYLITIVTWIIVQIPVMKKLNYLIPIVTWMTVQIPDMKKLSPMSWARNCWLSPAQTQVCIMNEAVTGPLSIPVIC